MPNEARDSHAGDSEPDLTLAPQNASAAATASAANQSEPVVLRHSEAPGIADSTRPRYVEAAIIIIASTVVIGLLRLGEAFFVPLLIGIVTSNLLGPVVTALHRARIPRSVGAGIVLSAAVALGAGGIYALSGDAVRLADELPSIAKKLRQLSRERLGDKPNPIANVHKAATELERAAKEASGQSAAPAGASAARDSGAARLENILLAGTSSALLRTSELLLALLIAYFLLSAGDTFRRKLVRIAGPSLARRRLTIEALDEINEQIQRYMFVLLITNVLIGLAVWALFAACGLDNAALWGVIAAVVHVIPYAGTAVLAAAAGVAALIQFESLLSAALVAAATLGIAVAIGMGLNTWLSSRFSRMNPVVVFAGLLFFGWLWGIWGLLLAVPVLAVIKAVAERVEEMHPIAELMREG
jgi:predicted PurR-regulated permease PerM